jgi:hypothetical protein
MKVKLLNVKNKAKCLTLNYLFIIKVVSFFEIIKNSLLKFNEIKIVQCRKLSKMYNFRAAVLVVFFSSLL